MNSPSLKSTLFNRRTYLVAALGGAALALVGCDKKPPSYTGIDLTGADFGRNFSLPDTEGRVRTLESFKGEYVLMFFGFTQCPDVCPTALGRAVEVQKLLGEDAKRVKVVLVSVDPERDTAQILRDYTAAFDPSFIALRGDVQATTDMAKEYKIHFSKVPAGDSYTMDHTALTYVLDTQGRLRLALRHEQSGEQVANDLRTLMEHDRG